MLRPALLLLTLLGAPLTAADETATERPGGTLIVLNKSDDTANFVDPASGEILATLETGGGPHEVAVSPDGRFAVVANYGTSRDSRFTNGNTLTVYDLGSGETRHVIDLGEYERPHGVQFVDATRMLATSEVARHVVLVDIEQGELLGAVPTDAEGSHMLVAAPDGKTAYTANMQSDSVSVLDLVELECVATIDTGSECEGIDITPDGKEVWATNRRSDSISIINTASREVVQTLPCGRFPIRIKFTPDGKHALVSNLESADVAVFDVARRKEVERIAMDLEAVDGAGERLFGDLAADSAAPIGILITPDGRWAFVANTNADVVTVIDLEELRVAGGYRTGRQPDGLGWTPATLGAAAPAPAADGGADEG